MEGKIIYLRETATLSSQSLLCRRTSDIEGKALLCPNTLDLRIQQYQPINITTCQL